MKFFRILGRNIRDSFKSVFRNFSLSLASISCITITLVVVSIAVILTSNVNILTKKVEESLKIVVFLNTDITPEEVDSVELFIEGIDNCEKDPIYTDKKAIREEWMKSSDIFNSIMANWTDEENPLQSTFTVSVKDINKISESAKQIETNEYVNAVKYGEGMIEKLVSVFTLVQKVSFITVIALVIVTAFLISNTIKITIFSRKREIEIMRLIGASNINIKVPFIIEGLFLGVLGAIIPIGVTIYGYYELYTRFNGQLFSQDILAKPIPFIYYICLILLGIGIVVGMYGSWRAVRKYLKI